MNLLSLSLSLVPFLLLLLCVVSLALVTVTVAADDDDSDSNNFPQNYRDDVYHCTNPIENNNQGQGGKNSNNNLFITCNPTTYLWNINELNPNKKPDNTDLCNELVGILLRSKQQEELNLKAQSSQLNNNVNIDIDVNVRDDIQIWESIMDNSVVDQLEPCVLWAMTYGSLTQYSSSSSYIDDFSSGGNANGQQQQTGIEIIQEGEGKKE
jgi:hypothetical protein